MTALKIRDDLTPSELRSWGLRQARGRPMARAFAIANALEGKSRAEAARLAGMERQALRDAVVRYNAASLAGLEDRARGRPRRKLTPRQEAALKELVLRGPDPEVDGRSAWTLADLCRLVEARFGQSYHPGALWKLLRRLGLSWQKTRPSHPKSDAAAREEFKKKALARL